MDENPYKSPESNGRPQEFSGLIDRRVRGLVQIALGLCGVICSVVPAGIAIEAISNRNGRHIGGAAAAIFGVIAVGFFYAGSRLPR